MLTPRGLWIVISLSVRDKIHNWGGRSAVLSGMRRNDGRYDGGQVVGSERVDGYFPDNNAEVTAVVPTGAEITVVLLLSGHDSVRCQLRSTQLATPWEGEWLVAQLVVVLRVNAAEQSNFACTSMYRFVILAFRSTILFWKLTRVYIRECLRTINFQ